MKTYSKIYFHLLWLVLDLSLIMIFLTPLASGISFYRENYKYAHYIFHTSIECLHAPFKDGYTDLFSYSQGDTQMIYINYRGKKDRKIYLYDVLGLKVDSLLISRSTQPKYPNPSVEGFQYEETTRYTVPDLPAGIYTWEHAIPFLVRGNDSASIVVVYPSNTIQAYNIAGGKSYYTLFSQQSPTISFERPVFPPISFMVHAMMKWLYTQPMKIRYISDRDMESERVLSGAKLIVLIGHSEYWSGQARRNFDQFVDQGGNALILSGNTMWWKIKYSEDMKQMTCYKNDQETGLPLSRSTGHWQEIIPVEHSIGVQFWKGGYGRKYPGNTGGFHILDTNYWVFEGVHWDTEPFIHVPTKEYDGTYLDTLSDGSWGLDTSRLSISRGKLLGYDYATDIYFEQIGAALIFQKHDSSGVILNFATTDWCSAYGIGGKDSLKIRKITLNALTTLQEPVQESEMTRFWE